MSLTINQRNEVLDFLLNPFIGFPIRWISLEEARELYLAPVRLESKFEYISCDDPKMVEKISHLRLN